MEERWNEHRNALPGHLLLLLLLSIRYEKKEYKKLFLKDPEWNDSNKISFLLNWIFCVWWRWNSSSTHCWILLYFHFTILQPTVNFPSFFPRYFSFYCRKNKDIKNEFVGWNVVFPLISATLLPSSHPNPIQSNPTRKFGVWLNCVWDQSIFVGI